VIFKKFGIKTVLGILICLFIIGYFLFIKKTPPLPTFRAVRQISNQYLLIDPLLFINTSRDTSAPYNALFQKLNSYIDSAEASKKIQSVSVYYRNLSQNEWTGVNESEMYAPASMLKVALMIAFLKKTETDPTILDKKVVYAKDSTDTEEYFRAPQILVPGKAYTIREMIVAMITESDNNANRILLKNIDTSFLAQVYQDLRLPLPTATSTDFMSARTYSTLFRTLYNATYLYHQLSEQALEVLAQTNFHDGLIAGVPASTTVAHKFGERTQVVNGVTEWHELHDCGIVYFPNDPYLLCVMTKGNDFDVQKKVIRDISSIVYNSEYSFQSQ
jgi:beta-lactamase class A